MKLTSLPPPSSLNKLLSFDFDDTLFDILYPGHVPEEFFELINSWRESYGVIWGINTGRSYNYLVEDYLTHVKAPFAPDFVITTERNIHLSDQNLHLRPLQSWNDACSMAHERLFRHHRTLLENIMVSIDEAYPNLIWWRQQDDPYSIEVEHPLDLDAISDIIMPAIEPYSDISTQRAGPYLRFCHAEYNKGSALAHVLKLLNIREDNTFIAGDGHNDMDAIKTNPLAQCACPSNGAIPLQELVLSRGGYVSTYAKTKGLADILNNFVLPWLKTTNDQIKGGTTL
ncbi:MAG: HAD hydrolase family protein [Akkermansia sp.]